LNIPKSIKIAGHNYKVIYPYDFIRNYKLGSFSPSRQEIRITDLTRNGSKRHKEQIMNTFCHEILHAIESEYVIECLKERDVELLSNGLYQVLRDNNLNFGE